MLVMMGMRAEGMAGEEFYSTVITVKPAVDVGTAAVVLVRGASNPKL